FFSGRRRHTRFSRDWSSDVCSSDLLSLVAAVVIAVPAGVIAAKGSGRLAGVVTSAITLTGLSVPAFWFAIMLIYVFAVQLRWFRSEERRVGRRCGSLTSPSDSHTMN